MQHGALKKIGRYQITRELGRGAMGIVYHAIDPTIGRPVAIKTLRLREVDDREQRLRLRERLFREARSAGALSHPGIVTIYDMDEVDGLAYIAMEFVDGETLEEILNRPQALTRDRLIEILRQAAAALDYAHRKGIIHRDIKPANVMIDTAGAVKITDFGIAKITQLEGQTLTGVLVGTPNYMSPEQVQGHEIDGRSDQFSLAVIGYEMLSGERPFFGEQISTVVYKIVAEQPVPIQNINATLTESIDKSLRRGLAKKPERRFGSCTAFVTALTANLDQAKNWRVLPRRAHQSIPTASTSAITRTFKPVRKRTPAESPAPVAAAPKRKRASFVFAFLAAFLILIALLGAVAWQTGILDLSWVADLFPPATAHATPPPRAEQLDPKPEPAITTPPPAADPPASTPVDEEPAPAVAKPERIPETKPAVAATYQQVQVMTDPSGATATLDGLGDVTCQTPCQLRVRAGTHTLTITRDGYQTESRELAVGHDDIDFPLVTLRSAAGLLLLTSDPSAAHVWIDGKPTDYVTPVRIPLPAGGHSISIQKDGLQSSDRVEIRNGALSTLKLSVHRQ